MNEIQSHSLTSIQLVTFSLGKDLFGINVISCREVLNLCDISTVPNTQPYMKGLIDLRGEIIPVIDMRTKLGFNEKAYDENSVILIVDNSDHLTGLIVDAVEDVLSVTVEDIQIPSHFTLAVDHDVISGVVKSKEQLLQILDLSHLFTQDEMKGMHNDIDTDIR